MPARPSACDRAGFVVAYGGVWEHSPWIAEATWDGGIGPAEDGAGGLHAAMCAVLDAADRARQQALIDAHPDLAGRLAVAGELTADSRREQASAGLDRCTPAEFARFQSLNAAYRARFGFPFIMAVKGRTRAEILDAFARRLDNDRETEFATALAEVKKIALLRLQDLLP
ncbi:MAG: 2-oxo-4-hydroxy-4-carboxy-5-ureidoimidazoline decarboxylase [Alphaproteobacteria bacterium]